MAKTKSSDAQQPEVTPTEAAPKVAAVEPFYTFQYLDGDLKEFKTRDDLDKGFRKSYTRQRELERKQREFDENSAALNQQLEELKKEREHERNVAAQYLEWDRKLNSDPNIYAQVKSILDGGNIMNGQVAPANEPSSELLERLERLEQQLEASQSQSKVDAAWTNIGSKYQDLNREMIEDLLAKVQDGDEEQLLDVLYHASRSYSLNGRPDAQVEQEAGAEKSLADLTPPGTTVSNSGPEHYGSAQEAADAAYKAAGITS